MQIRAITSLFYSFILVSSLYTNIAPIFLHAQYLTRPYFSFILRLVHTLFILFWYTDRDSMIIGRNHRSRRKWNLCIPYLSKNLPTWQSNPIREWIKRNWSKPSSILWKKRIMEQDALPAVPQSGLQEAPSLEPICVSHVRHSKQMTARIMRYTKRSVKCHSCAEK